MEGTIDTGRPRAFDPSQATPGAVPPRPSWDLNTEQRIGDGEALAHALAWVSVGMGLVHFVAPRRVGEQLGMEDWSELIRAHGVRQIAFGMGILTQRDATQWVWARVAGDAIDLATLATRLTPGNPKRRNVAALMAVTAGLMVMDVVCGRQLAKHERH